MHYVHRPWPGVASDWVSAPASSLGSSPWAVRVCGWSAASGLLGSSGRTLRSSSLRVSSGVDEQKPRYDLPRDSGREDRRLQPIKACYFSYGKTTQDMYGNTTKNTKTRTDTMCVYAVYVSGCGHCWFTF